MNVRVFAALLCLAVCFALPPQSFARWEKQNSGTLAWLRSLYFLDSARGFVVGGNGTILQTTNGGETWTKIESPTLDNLRDITFFDEKNGWILAQKNEFARRKTEARSYLLRTTDGGATWRTQNFPFNPLNSRLVRFVRGDKRIWAIGESGALYALNPNGATWQKQPPPTEYLLLGGFSIGEKQNWLVGAGGSLLYTVDGGATWRNANFAQTDKLRLNAAFFASPKIGWLVGANGKILKTGNGIGWQEQTSPTTADLLDVQFVSEREGWAAGEAGTLLRTVDGGANWSEDVAPNAAAPRLERLFFVREAAAQPRGWAVGFGGTILVRVN